ncbi:MAG: EAL domain-containing protein [Gallionella sp.]
MTRALIVEDKEENLYYLRALLEGNGWVVDSACHGAEALVKARQSPPDVIISDLLMPVMDGYSLLRRWKADARLKDIPFIVYTATYTEEDDERLAMDLGADAFILKPSEPQDFIARLREVQANAGAAKPALPHQPAGDENTLLRYYSETLIRKLEDKTLQLEEANSAQRLELAERRSVEEELGFKNRILQTQQETSLDAILVVDENQKILFHTEKFIDLWGLPAESLRQGQDAPVFKVADQIENEDAFVAQVKYLYEHRNEKSIDELRFKDGRIIDRYSAPITDTDGTYYGRVWYFRDVTETRRAQQALQAKEHEQRQLARMLEVERSRLVAAQQVAKVGSWETDLASMAVIWSDETYRIFETDPANFHGTHQDFVKYVHPEDRAVLDEAFVRSINRCSDGVIEHRLLLPNDRIKFVEERWQFMFDDQGKPARAIGTCQDITGRKQSETALKASESRYHLLFENMLEGYAYCRAIFEQDQLLDFVYIEVNSAFEKLTGLKDVAGKKVSDVIPRVRETNREIFEVYARVVLTGKPEKFETHVAGLDIWLSLAVYSHDKEHFVAVFDNISQRKETEARIRYLNRVYAVLSGINELIVRANDRDRLFREACRVAVEAGGFRMAMICVVDRSDMRIVPVASEGKDEELMDAIKKVWLSSEDTQKTMTAQVIREKQVIVSNDSQSDRRVVFRKKYAEAGVRSMAIFPLIVSDEAVGTLALYASEVGFFQEGEVQLLTELAMDIAFAIDHIGKQERLNYLAYYDALTGLANHSLFFERVGQFIRSAESGGHKLALLLIDLERFKNLNDSLGRAAGDALLKQVAEWLKQNLGEENLLARLDADHFAVVMPKVKQEGDLTKLLDKKSKAFLEHPFQLNDAVFRIAAKAGIALFPDDGSDVDTLFNNAEAALKVAKRSGDRYLFHTRKMTEAVASKLTLENQLRRAIDNEEFVLHYQPKVNLVSGKVTSAEALIRWNDPRTGLVPPGRFIPILEETGLIYDVGRWALRQAIADYLRWRAAGLAAVRIAVNVSPLQLRNPGFAAEIERKIGINAHAAEGLELEITESMIMEDMKRNVLSLQAIRAMGITVAIDDFGTGFSSLGYLAKLPADTLKIDRSFVVEMTAGPEGLALVSTIIDLAHALKFKVVAEGVETEEQANLLRLLSCDEMQGYLFSKPVPVDDFEKRFLGRT